MKYAKHTTGKTFRSFMLAAGMLSGMAMHAQLDMGCGFDVMHQQLMSTDPVYAQRVNAFSTMVQNAVPSYGRSLTTYKVPVVVHVMETGTAATAITDAQIRAFIKRTNEYWRKAPGSLGDGSGEDMTIEFVLAVRDPQGNCTTGITRTDMTWNSAYVTYGVGGSGISDADLKSYQHWSPTNYYNIWLVGTIAGAGGYAAFAVNHGSPTDGAVMRAGSTGSYLMAHEMGHAFNLYHTYAGDNGGTQCPPNAIPSVDGDEVWDTPPHIRPSGCNPTGTNACDNNSLNSLHQYNYLNLNGYPYCDPNMFTAGQRDRAVLALTGLRASFLASNGNMSLVPPASPQLDFSASTNMICGTGQTVTIDDLSSCLPDSYLDDSQFPNITYAWSITNGVDTYTSSARRPTFTLNSLGIYNVTLTVTTSLGTFTRTENGVVVVVAAPVAACTPTTTLVGGYGQVVNNVIFNTISSYTSPATNAALTDLSCTHKTILAAGGTYPLAVTIRAGGTGPEVLMGYIDYNNNGIFEDPSELVISGSTPANSSATINANVTLPIGAVTNTLLRMRLFGEVGTLTANERNCLAATYIGDAEDYGVYISNALASVSIGAAPGTTFTYGTNVTFTPTPVNGGASPVYTWFRNGVPVATGSTYQSNNLLPGETIRCEMASNLAGVLASPALSNTLTMTVTGPPLSEFSAAPRALCPGGTVTFTDASALSPTSWSWSFPGGTPSSSTAQNPVVTYNTPGTYSVTLVASNANGAGSSMTKTGYITVFNAPAAACTHTRTQSPGADVGITNVTLNTINHSTPNNDAAMNDFTCSQVTALQISTQYPISVRGGLYNTQWFRVYIDYNNNGVFTDAGELVFAPPNAMGTVTGTFTTPPNPVINTLLRMRVINDNAAWNAIPGPCTNVAVGQSEDYGVYFTPSTVASVSIAASPSSTVTSGTLVTFTPTPVNGGGAPTYQWFRNNIQVGTGSTYQSNSFATGETVHCVMTSNLPGVIGSPATSNTVTMTVSPAPCTAPTATATPVCAGAQYGVNVNLTNMGSATSIAIQVDNDAGGPNGFSTVQTVTGTGNYGPFGAYASGAAVHVRLAHNLDAGCNLNLNNVVTTCTGPGSTCQYSSTTTTNIVDNTTVTNTINVPALGGQVITDLDVFVNITHPNSADLRLSLQSPTGTSIALINTGVCGTNDNMTVEFDQQATTAIGVVCPMTNIYAIPSASLAGFNTQVMQGTWTLSVQDVTTGNTGVLNSWCLMPTLAPAPCVAPTATATPVCAGAQYGVNVNLTNMGSATSIAIQVDNDAGGPNGFSTVQTVTGTGNYGPFGAYASGAAVHVRLVHNLDAGCNLNLNNVVTTCSGPGSTCTYSSTTPTNIVDNTTVTNTITVPPLGGQTITDLDVFVNITHTYVGDLLLSLQSPTGTTIALINTGLCGSADNMTVEFDQQAGSAIGAVCPMTNIYAIPTGSLAGFNGEVMQGIWTLSVQDVANSDVGVLNSWCLMPVLAPPPCTAPTATATPACAGAQYGVNVNLTNMGSATSIAIQVDNDAGGPNGYTTVQTVTATGNYGPFGTYASGSPVNVRLVHNVSATCDLDLNNVVTTCYVPGGGCVYSSTAPTNILDEATVTNSITVPSLGAQVITDLNVYVNITHTYIGDLLISLQSPTGTIIPLVSTGVCGGNPNMTVEFDQQATTGIGVVCPMNNLFAIPAASLAGFNGELMQGTWTLIVQDAVGGDFGTLNSWCLIPTLGAAGIQVSPKVFLEGPYNITTGLMSDALRSASLVPNTQPYTALGYVFTGSPGAGGTIGAGVLTTSGNDAIVDWVIVELRSTTLSTTVVASCAALLQRDGDVVALDGISPVSMAVPAGSYHVAVLHRNHLGAMTFSGVALSATPAVVDLRSASTATYGNNARKTVSGAFPAQVLWAGDVSFNGIIKYTGADNDRDPILQAIGGSLPTNTISGYLQEDVNMDTQVKYTGSANDRDPILQNIGGTVPTNTRVEQMP